MRPDTYVPVMCALSAGFFILGATVGSTTVIDITAIIENLTNIAVGLAAAVACFVGIEGLSKWKSQLKGTDNHELAKRVLQSTYRLREAVKTVRNPIFFPNEFPSDIPAIYPRDTTERKRNEYEGLKFGTAYQKRLKILSDAWIDLYELRVEIETLWGDASVDIVDEFTVMMHQLKDAVENKVDAVSQGDTYKNSVLHFKLGLNGLDETEFGQEINSAVKDIEENVRRFIYK